MNEQITHVCSECNHALLTKVTLRSERDGPKRRSNQCDKSKAEMFSWLTTGAFQESGNSITWGEYGSCNKTNIAFLLYYSILGAKLILG